MSRPTLQELVQALRHGPRPPGGSFQATERGCCGRHAAQVSTDYGFPANEGSARITILIAQERLTQMTCAKVVGKKGTTGQFAARRLHPFLRELGQGRIDVFMISDGGLGG